jgi:TPR repeat protein
MEHEYKDCPQLHEVDRLIHTYYEKGDYETCFAGCLKLAEEGYSLAQCQVGYFYYMGQGIEKNLQKAYEWTAKAAAQGDPDAPENLIEIAEQLKQRDASLQD